jgi:hypothetical protein
MRPTFLVRSKRVKRGERRWDPVFAKRIRLLLVPGAAPRAQALVIKEQTTPLLVIWLAGGLNVKGPRHALKRVDQDYCIFTDD